MTLEQLFALAADLGSETHGVVRAGDLRCAAADPDTVARALERHWQAPVRGIYVPHRNPLSDIELAHVGSAHAGPGSVVTGLLAGRVLGLRWLPEVPGVLVLVTPDVQHVDSTGLVALRRIGGLAEVEVTEWNGVLLPPPARIVVDACQQYLDHRKRQWGSLRAPARRRAFDTQCLRTVRGIVLGAVADGRCTPAEILGVLDAGSPRDTKLIRRACADAERGVASPPEAEQADDLMDCNVPFVCNAELWDGDRLVAVVDALLLGTGVGSELDSKERHSEAEALDLTLGRHRRVEGYGVTLLHIVPTRYRAAPSAHLDDLFAEARRRLARGLGDPPGLQLRLRGPILCGSGTRRPYPGPAWALEAVRTGDLPPHLTARSA